MADLLQIFDGELGARFWLGEDSLHMLSLVWRFWRGVGLFSKE
jgi:hypothetical protein